MEDKIKIAASILAADASSLKEQLPKLNTADFIHVDIIEEDFTKGVGVSDDVFKMLKQTQIPLDIHLMVNNPLSIVDNYICSNTKIITIHQEMLGNKNQTINYIKKRGIKTGLAINPDTPVNSIISDLQSIDVILLMSVNPGLSGQSFIMNSLEKIKELSDIRRKNNFKFLIEVDGGINPNIAKQLKVLNADIIVSGSSIFNAKDIEKQITKFKNI